LKTRTSIPVIFDSHEDYFNQQYEYSRKSLSGLIKGISARANEILNIRYMDAVFCTDPFLAELYRLPFFAAPRIVTVRNIPPREMIRKTPVVNQRDNLKLVYLGSVNHLRGIIETARYCARFNAESEATRNGLSLAFHLFSKPNAIVDNLVKEGLLTYHGYLPRPQIETEIANYDVGVSLILPSKKFSRNILIKNFEYMAMGIPILTSNYGTMKQYVGEAGAGVLIDPVDYAAFRDGMLLFKDRVFRRRCGENGIAYAEKHFQRDVESAPYLDTVGRLLGNYG
jgi:glycosyltransferase involved in cell wall biosynthesis